MDEKLSNKHLRQDKVNFIKQKLLIDIETIKSEYVGAIRSAECTNGDPEIIRYSVTMLHYLYILHDYLAEESAFMQYRYMDEEDDIICYDIDMDMIEYILHDGINALSIVERMINKSAFKGAVSDQFIDVHVLTPFHRMGWSIMKKEFGL